MTQEQYKQLVIKYAEIKKISKDQAAKIIIETVKNYVDETKREIQNRKFWTEKYFVQTR